MTIRHTPGPWAISGRHHSIGIAPDDEKSDGIATVFGIGPQAEANAAIIAAAPELLLALQNLLDYPSEGWAMKQARVAIAKAKGEA